MKTIKQFIDSHLHQLVIVNFLIIVATLLFVFSINNKQVKIQENTEIQLSNQEIIKSNQKFKTDTILDNVKSLDMKLDSIAKINQKWNAEYTKSETDWSNTELNNEESGGVCRCRVFHNVLGYISDKH